MRKIQFFILVETLLFSLAFFDALRNEGARIFLIVAILLLALKFLLGRKGVDVLLTTASVLLFIVFALNIYFILAILFALTYLIINSFARYEKINRYSQVLVDEKILSVRREKTSWFGQQDYSQTHFGFDDVNVTRLFGNDIIDLDQAIVTGTDNVILIRKVFGKTKIIVPVDVEVSLSASSLYGRVSFLGEAFWDLRNESISATSPAYDGAYKKVKIVLNTFYGDVEVVRV